MPACELWNFEFESNIWGMVMWSQTILAANNETIPRLPSAVKVNPKHWWPETRWSNSKIRDNTKTQKIPELSKFSDWDENTEQDLTEQSTKSCIMGRAVIRILCSCHPTKAALLQLSTLCNLNRHIYAILQYSDPRLWLVNYPSKEASHWPLLTSSHPVRKIQHQEDLFIPTDELPKRLLNFCKQQPRC